MLNQNYIRKNRGRRRGATLVEFAFFFLLFLVLAVGLMELGRGIWTFTTLAHAARQGARYAIAHGSLSPIGEGDSSIEDVVKQSAVGLDPSSITVSTVYSPSNTRGSVVEVRVQYPFQLVTGPLVLANSTLQLGSTTRMIIAN
jgi:Flp pilus assembly protein TadG